MRIGWQNLELRSSLISSLALFNWSGSDATDFGADTVPYPPLETRTSALCWNKKKNTRAIHANKLKFYPKESKKDNTWLDDVKSQSSEIMIRKTLKQHFFFTKQKITQFLKTSLYCKKNFNSQWSKSNGANSTRLTTAIQRNFMLLSNKSKN